jgi:hypothetical protein
MLGPAPKGPRGEIEATGGSFPESALDLMAELVEIQRVAVARAHAQGLNPDKPLHLTGSAILSS